MIPHQINIIINISVKKIYGDHRPYGDHRIPINTKPIYIIGFLKVLDDP
jgi:hypothetical protein